MKNKLLGILPLVIFIFTLLAGCRGTIPINEISGDKTKPQTYSAAERIEAITYYKGLYPISAEIRQVSDDWNALFIKASKRQIPLKDAGEGAKNLGTRLTALYSKLAMLKPTSRLQSLNDDVNTTLDIGVITFSLYYEGLTNNQSYKVFEADNKIKDMNRIISQAAKEWNEGADYYSISPSDIRY